MFITPLVLVFDEVKEVMIVPQLVFDSIWCIGIILNFIIADKGNYTFKEIALKYLKSGRFFIDALSTLPAMFTLEQNGYVQFLKFLRLIHFQHMFMPLKKLMKLILPNKSTFEIDDIFGLTVIFAAMIMIAHMSACMWIYLGHIQDQLAGAWEFDEGAGGLLWKDDPSQPGIRETWLMNSDFVGYNNF